MSMEKKLLFSLKIAAVGAEIIFYILKLNFLLMKFSPRTCTSTKYTKISSCVEEKKRKV